MTLIVPGKSAASADPREGSFDNPALGQNDEPVTVAATDDLQAPLSRPIDGSLHLFSLVARVADDPLDEREGPSGLAEKVFRAVSVLDAGRVNVDRQEEAQRIGQDVALTADHLLARVIPRGIERSPPLTAPFAV